MQAIKFLFVVQSLSHVRLFVIPWTATSQASLSFTASWSLLKFMSMESVMFLKSCSSFCSISLNRKGINMYSILIFVLAYQQQNLYSEGSSGLSENLYSPQQDKVQTLQLVCEGLPSMYCVIFLTSPSILIRVSKETELAVCMCSCAYLSVYRLSIYTFLKGFLLAELLLAWGRSVFVLFRTSKTTHIIYFTQGLPIYMFISSKNPSQTNLE